MCFSSALFPHFSWYYHDKKQLISRFFTKLSATPRSHRVTYFFVFCWNCARLGSHRVTYFFTFRSSFGSILGSGRSHHSLAFLFLTHKTNMFVKHAKTRNRYNRAHTGTRLGGAIWGSQKAIYTLNLVFFVAKWAPEARRRRATRIPLPDPLAPHVTGGIVRG